MNTLAFFLFVLVVIFIPARNSLASGCPSELPFEVYLDCAVAEGAAESDKSEPPPFASEEFNLSERLQAWVDSQMQRDIARDDEASPESNEVAEREDEH